MLTKLEKLTLDWQLLEGKSYNSLVIFKRNGNIGNDLLLCINVSSTNSEQSKLCINGPLQIDARLLWKQAIGSNSP